MVMTEISVPRIEEEDLYRSQGTVRAMLVTRYEGLWALCDGQRREAEDLGARVDPRWAEIGVRVLKELAGLYRLGSPPRLAEEDSDVLHGLDPRVVALQALEDLAAKAGS